MFLKVKMQHEWGTMHMQSCKFLVQMLFTHHMIFSELRGTHITTLHAIQSPQICSLLNAVNFTVNFSYFQTER